MHTFADSAPGSIAVVSRRKLIGSAAAGAAALAWPFARGNAQAQSLSGTIRVGYESSYAYAIPFIEATSSELLQEHPEATVELEPSPGGSFITQLVLQLAGGQAPDVFLLAGAALGELADAGFVAPLDDFVAAWDGWTQYPDPFKSLVTYNGSVWAIPHPIDTHFLYYRRDIFERAGLPVEWQPASPDEVLEFALTIKSTVPDVIPYALYAGANGGLSTVGRAFMPLVYAFGGAVKDDDGLWIIDSCAIRSALGYYERAYQIDQTVPQDVMTGASPTTAMPEAMFNGELAIVYEGSWEYGRWLQEDPESTRDQIGYVLFPGAGDRPPFAMGSAGYSWYINARSENKNLAWAFIEAFNTAENQVAINVIDPHIPGRLDAANDPAFQEDPFLQAMVASSSSLILAVPDPAFRQLITIIQNATGIVATNEATPDEAIERYISELTRVLGEENVVRQVCP